jgi:CRP-like cAMP-binding protein
VRANDTEARGSYSQVMTRTREEHTMKRIATIAAVLTTAAVVAPVATAGSVVQVKPQISAQIARVQVAKVQRANTAVTVQRHTVQLAKAKRFSILLHSQIR